MKKTILSIALTVLFLASFGLNTFAQTIRRVNNNSGITGVNVYTTIQAAHDAAVANDIISIEPSVTSYGTLDCRKPLKIIGNGYYLDKVSNGPGDNRTSKTSTISFNYGSVGSTLTGVFVNGIYINDINITISRCRVTSHIYSGQSTNQNGDLSSQGNDALINKCFLIAPGGINGQSWGNNWVLSNNIMYSYISNLKNSLVSNNTQNYRDYGQFATTCSGTLFTNNIIDNRNGTTTIELVTGGTGNVVANNITLGSASTPTGSGNVSGANETTTFLVDNPWSTYNTEDGPFKLAVGSPAIGVGFGGVDCGAYGNTSPYIQAGLPPIPLITSFLTSALGNTTNPLTVNVAVRSNN